MKVTAKIETARVGCEKYPYFGAAKVTGLIVLFVGPNAGIVVVPDGTYRVGVQRHSWEEKNFVPFYGSINIEREAGDPT